MNVNELITAMESMKLRGVITGYEKIVMFSHDYRSGYETTQVMNYLSTRINANNKEVTLHPVIDLLRVTETKGV